MKHVVMFSGGIGSWAAAKIIANRFGKKDLYLLFTDVKGNNDSPHVGEDEDTYRFIEDAVKNVGGTYVYLNTGMDIWETFKKHRFLGNSRLAKCSHELKQKPARDWLDENCDPAETIVYVGIDWTETHRIPAIQRNYVPYQVDAPLTEPPYLEKKELIQWAEREGLKVPRLYALGFAHNNCGGGCVRAGQGQFKQLLDLMPERYAVWEAKEAEMAVFLDKPVSILTEVKAGVKVNLTLKTLRERNEQNPALIDRDDIAGCACFVEDYNA